MTFLKGRGKRVRVAIIIGASSGIGEEFVRQMDRGFYTVEEFWLVARSEEKLEELASTLNHACKIFSMDVTKQGQLQRLEYTAKLENAKICMLIVCAGMGKTGDFSSIPMKTSLDTLRLNCLALTEAIGRLLPFMQKNARIITLGSASAFFPQPGFSTYAASKAYVLSFSRAIGRELRSKCIYVTCVCPGPVDTPFLQLANEGAKPMPIKKFFTAKPGPVVEKALRDSSAKKPVSVYGISMLALEACSKLLPHEIFIRGTQKIRE